MSFIEDYVAKLHRLRLFVIAFWLLCACFGAWKVTVGAHARSTCPCLLTSECDCGAQAMAFINETDVNFSPPSDSLAIKATVGVGSWCSLLSLCGFRCALRSVAF